MVREVEAGADYPRDKDLEMHQLPGLGAPIVKGRELTITIDITPTVPITANTM